VPFALPVELTFDVEAADATTPVDGNLAFVFQNLQPLNAGMVGGTLDTEFDTPNEAFNGEFTVASILGSQLVTTVPYVGGFSNPAAGTATINYQPENTRSDLPRALTPWQLYLTTFACIEIRKGRSQGVGDFMDTLASETKRAITMSKTRTEGVRQAPMTRSRMRRRGFSYGER
jgi:hypothetical protein